MSAIKKVLYIDNSNIFRGCKKTGWRPSYRKIREFLEIKEGPIEDVHFFASEQQVPREKQARFYSALKNDLGFHLHTYQLAHRKVVCPSCGHEEWIPTEKGVDVGLVTQLLKDMQCDNFDTALVMSSDRDFLDAICEIMTVGRKVKIIAWKWTLPQETMKTCRENDIPLIFLEDYQDNFRKAEGDIL